MKKTIAEQIRDLAVKEGRYRLPAYFFLFEALDHTVEKLVGEKRHVSGRELLEGIRLLAAEQFGPMAPMVFNIWGVTRTEDFGEMVFQLVEAGLMGKTEQDDRKDFANGFRFEQAFSLEKTLKKLPKLN